LRRPLRGSGRSQADEERQARKDRASSLCLAPSEEWDASWGIEHSANGQTP